MMTVNMCNSYKEKEMNNLINRCSYNLVHTNTNTNAKN